MRRSSGLEAKTQDASGGKEKDERSATDMRESSVASCIVIGVGAGSKDMDMGKGEGTATSDTKGTGALGVPVIMITQPGDTKIAMTA